MHASHALARSLVARCQLRRPVPRDAYLRQHVGALRVQGCPIHRRSQVQLRRLLLHLLLRLPKLMPIHKQEAVIAKCTTRVWQVAH